MPDQYEKLRSLPLSAVAELLSIDLSKFKTRNLGELYGPCPVHRPKNNTTSFSYAADGRWFCFSCQSKGKGTIDLTKAVRQIGFQAAVALLKPLEGIELPAKEKTALAAVSESVVTVYKGELDVPAFKSSYAKFFQPCEWLSKRIPSQEILERYGVGFYQNNARKSAYSGKVLLPVRRSTNGETVGYLARTIEPKEGESKYHVAKGLPKSLFLFGAAEIVAGMFGTPPLECVFLVESPFCVMKFASLGLPALSPFGWSVSREQLDLLTSLTRGVVYIPDRDKFDNTGQVFQTLATRLWIRCPPLPAGIDDPEQLDREQILSL